MVCAGHCLGAASAGGPDFISHPITSRYSKRKTLRPHHDFHATPGQTAGCRTLCRICKGCGFSTRHTSRKGDALPAVRTRHVVARLYLCLCPPVLPVVRKASPITCTFFFVFPLAAPSPFAKIYRGRMLKFGKIRVRLPRGGIRRVRVVPNWHAPRLSLCLRAEVYASRRLARSPLLIGEPPIRNDAKSFARNKNSNSNRRKTDVFRRGKGGLGGLAEGWWQIRGLPLLATRHSSLDTAFLIG